MQTPDKKLLKKYFEGSATQVEAKIVLDWFETREGIQYIEESFESYEAIPEKSFKTNEKRQARLHNINSRIETGRKGFIYFFKHKTFQYKYQLVASSILVLFSLLYLLVFSMNSVSPPEAITYTTGPSENRNIVLSDGTSIWLSESSTIKITEDEESGNTATQLEGQAFFDVMKHQGRQFTVQSSGTEISVLGTSFNVNTHSRTKEVIVAVSNGIVSFRNTEYKNRREIILTENMIGLFDSETGEIKSESTKVHNYLSWIHKSISFSNTPFESVLKQLERIFEITNKIEDRELLDLKLTANFQRGSVDQVLSMISEGLEIDYDYQDGRVHWTVKN
ncbi:MAG: FecR family protein [Balneolaceae bacterium]